MNGVEVLLKKVCDTTQSIPAYYSRTGYNLFRTLEISGKEVLMCRFLADLLNPEGDHGCGILFLKTEAVLQYLDAIHSISDGRKRKIMEKTMDVLRDP